MKPEAGVAATRPEIVPEHQLAISHSHARRQSRSSQVIAPNIAVKFEFQQAMVVRGLALKDKPPLKPRQPNHREMVPSVLRNTLWGQKFSIIFS
jgi:hypothetical protein